MIKIRTKLHIKKTRKVRKRTNKSIRIRDPNLQLVINKNNHSQANPEERKGQDDLSNVGNVKGTTTTGFVLRDEALQRGSSTFIMTQLLEIFFSF